MNQLTKIFDNKSLRIIDQDNDIWFVAKDVCEVLDINNNRQALSRLEDDEQSRVSLNDGRQNRQFKAVNEFGLYNLVLGSRKPEAKQFKRWITHEVIPSIRKTGTYKLEKPQSQLEILQGAVNELASQDERITTLEETMRIDGRQEQVINKRAKHIVVEALGGKSSNAYKTMAFKVFSAFWRDFKNHFEIPRYGDLPRKQFEEGLRFIGMWTPSTSLRIEIDEANGQQTIEVV